MKNNQNLSWEEIGKRFAQTEQLIKKTSQQIKETKQLVKATTQQMKETDRRLEKMRAETDAKIDKRDAETKERLDQLGKYLGGVANSNGDMAEEYFFNTFRRDKTFANEKFDKIRQNVSYPEDDNDPEIECDIILINGKSTALIEVKYNAKPENIKIEELIARAKYLKENSIKHKNHDIYLGVAALSFKRGFARKLRNAGIATIHQIGKKMVVYDKEVKVF